MIIHLFNKAQALAVDVFNTAQVNGYSLLGVPAEARRRFVTVLQEHLQLCDQNSSSGSISGVFLKASDWQLWHGVIGLIGISVRDRSAVLEGVPSVHATSTTLCELEGLDAIGYQLAKVVRSLSTSCPWTSPASDNASAQLALALLRSDTLQAYAQLLAADLDALQVAGSRIASDPGSDSATSVCRPSPSTPLPCAPAPDPTPTSASNACPVDTAASDTSPPSRSSVAAKDAATNAGATALPSDAAPIAASTLAHMALTHISESVEILTFLCASASHHHQPGVDPALRRRLQEELLAALADSCLLEHVCGLRMAVQEMASALPEDHAPILASSQSLLLTLLSESLPELFFMEHSWRITVEVVKVLPARSPPLAPPQRAALRRVLSGLCLQLYLGWALAAPLSAAAGRPLFGLPPSLVPAGDAAQDVPAAFRDAVKAGSGWWGQLLKQAEESASTDSTMPCPGAAQATAESRPTASNSAPQSAGRLPYKVRHVVGLLMDALRHAQPQPGEERLHLGALYSLGCCVATAVPWVRPHTSAAWLAGLWPMLLRVLPDIPQIHDAINHAVLLGHLLLASWGQTSASSSTHAGAGGPSPSLRAALDAGLVPALERAMRAGIADSIQASALLIEFALRRPGVWPALLAHGPPAQVASLIVTMRKVLSVLRDCKGCTLWDMQLVALLEQAAAVLQGPDGEAAAHGSSSATAAGAGSSRGGGGTGVAALGWAVAERYCRQLTVNRCVSGLRSGTAGGVRTDCQVGPTDTDRLVDGPSWGHILHAGGCPPPGSPAAEQQRRLAVFAASQWLPVLTTVRRDRPQSEAKGCLLSVYSANRAYLVLYHWMLIAARECCVARVQGQAQRDSPGEGGSGEGGGRCGTASAAVHESWSALLRNCDAIAQATCTIMAAAAPAAVPPMLDLCELLVAGASGLEAGLSRTHWLTASRDGPGGPLELVLKSEIAALLKRHKRHGLLAALEQVVPETLKHGGRLPPGWRPPAPGLAAAAALSRPGSWRPLPPPCEAGAEALGLVGSCANPACTVLAGASEAEVGAAVACGKCGAVRYCCMECKRAHWRGGHGAECQG